MVSEIRLGKEFMAKIRQESTIIIANDLGTGRSVFFTASSEWSDSVHQAQLLGTPELASARLELAINDARDNLVIDPYLVAVNEAKDAIDIREKIRVSGGPTINVIDDAAVDRAA